MEETTSKVEEVGLGVQGDDLAQITEEQMLGNLNNDVKAYTKALDTTEKDRENYLEQLEVDKKLWDILGKEGALVKLNPEHEYEKNPEYWKLQEQKFGFKLRMDKAMAEGRAKEFDVRIETTTKALQDAKDKLERFSGGEKNE